MCKANISGTEVSSIRLGTHTDNDNNS